MRQTSHHVNNFRNQTIVNVGGENATATTLGDIIIAANSNPPRHLLTPKDGPLIQASVEPSAQLRQGSTQHNTMNSSYGVILRNVRIAWYGWLHSGGLKTNLKALGYPAIDTNGTTVTCIVYVSARRPTTGGEVVLDSLQGERQRLLRHILGAFSCERI